MKANAPIVMLKNVIMFVAFAMPTAGLASAFADSLGGDTKNAVAFTLGTTIISIVTIPVLYCIFKYVC